MPTDSNRLDVAVFIDFENVYVSVRDKLDANPNFESIMDRVSDFGRVVIARAYADWYRYPRVTSALYANGIEPMYVPTYYYDREMGRTGRAIKNSVDMNLCVDAMKTLFTNPNIAKFVLATGDRDFIPLVNTIRQQGKEVIVIGIGGAASAHLAQSADEFIFYESLVGKQAASLLPDQPRTKSLDQPRGREEAPAESSTPTPTVVPTPAPAPMVATNGNGNGQDSSIYDVLVRAIHLARERGYVCSFGSLKLLMKELMGGEFKEGKYRDSAGKPFAKFKDFVLEAERRNKVQVFTNGTVNEVFLPGEDPYTLSQFAQELKEEPAAPAPDAAPAETRTESRSIAAGRNRRRRRPRGQRPTSQGALVNGNDDETEAEDEIELLTDITADDEIGVGVDVSEPIISLAELYLPSLDDASLSVEQINDMLFEEMIEQVEQEEAQHELLEALEPEILDEAAEAVQDEQFVEPTFTPSQSASVVVESRPFTDEEWVVLRDVMSQFTRPVSFAQIHDALRDNRNRSNMERTNEELRTLVKQGINSGMLQRLGKGNRITYQLAQLAEMIEGGAEEATAIDYAAESTSDLVGMVEGDSSAPHEILETIDSRDQIDEAQQPQDYIAPEADVAVAEELAAFAPDGEVAPLADASSESIAEALVAEPIVEEPKKPARRRRKPAADAAAQPEAAADEPKKPTRRRKTADAAVQPEAAAEEPKKPARRRRKPAADESAS